MRPLGLKQRVLDAVLLQEFGELLGSGQTMGSGFVGGMMVTPALTFGRLLGSNLPLGAA